MTGRGRRGEALVARWEAIYQHHHAVRVRWTAHSLTYSNSTQTNLHKPSIEKRHLKSTSANTENLQSLLLDESNSSITISFGLIDIGDANSPPKVKITVRERLDSGIVKVVWNNFMESGPAANNNAYRFTSFLTSSLRDANKDIAELRAELAKAKADMTGWKDTASKLDGILQKEKDGLTERFLVLYNRVKQDLRNAKKELSEEKKKKTVRVEPLVQNALAPEEPMAPQNHDDQVELMWDANMVETMAAGPAKKKPSAATKSRPTGATAAKQPTKRTLEEEAPTAKKAARHNGGDSPSKKHTSRGAKDSDPDSDEDKDDDLGASQSQARSNPYSGATEMWGPGGIFADSQGGQNDFETYRKKRETQRKAKAKSSTSKDLSEMAKSVDKSPNGSGAKTIDLAGDGSSSEDSV